MPRQKPIVVTCVPDEYEHMKRARHACGGKYEVGERTTKKPTPGSYVDQFALTCKKCGKRASMSFRVDATTDAYVEGGIAGARKKHGRAAATAAALAATSDPIAAFLFAMLGGETKPARKSAKKPARRVSGS